jgi:hypothetical protein
MGEMKDTLTLRYSGPAVNEGRMDAYETAACIMAFADYLGVVAQAAHGPQARIKTEVKAFSHGSFAVEFALSFAGILATLFTGVASPKDIYDLVRGSFDAWKHLDGKDPQKITVTNGKAEIINHLGHGAIYRAEVINIISAPEGAAAVGRFVRRAVANGIESVSIERTGEAIAECDEAHARGFGLLVAQETLTENTVRQWLMLESPTFKKGNQWRFSDGATAFHAPIEDTDFLSRVARREALFGQDDALLVDLQIRQSGQPGALKMERTVLKVHDHKHAPKQESLI